MTGNNKKLNLALVGAGGIGKRWAWAIKRFKKAALLSIADINLVKAKSLAKQFKNCEAISDWRKILKRGDVNSVIVATPHKFLAPISFAALRAGKNVLCEKPGGIHSAELKKVITEAKKNKLCYMIGFNHRFYDAFLKARKIVDSGTIGKIIFIRARYGFGGRPGYEKEWRFNKKISGGGVLIDQGVHMIDLVRSFIGNCQIVRGFAENTFWKSSVEDNAFLILKNKNKQLASIHVSWSNWKALHNFEIYGAKGYVGIEGLGRKYGGSEKLILGLRDSNFKNSPKEKVITCNPEADNALIWELREFQSAIAKNHDPIIGGQDAYEVLKIVEKIYAKK